ncbi:MAG: CAP domain-containing protein [Actinomycetota bacterium]|nr:CAP domain-containing protein [Actinomycetota bacterium]
MRQCVSRFALMLGVCGLLLVAGPRAEPASAAGPCNKWGDKLPTEISKGEAREAVLCLLNRERSARGIRRLERDKKLQRASQRHTDYMQSHSCFSHQCPGEPSLTKRLQNVGWLTGGLSRWAYAENIGWAGGDLGTPRSIVEAWMQSTGHRDNILSRTFDEVGVGYSKGTIYSKNAVGSVVTADFGFKRG